MARAAAGSYRYQDARWSLQGAAATALAKVEDTRVVPPANPVGASSMSGVMESARALRPRTFTSASRSANGARLQRHEASAAASARLRGSLELRWRAEPNTRWRWAVGPSF